MVLSHSFTATQLSVSRMGCTSKSPFARLRWTPRPALGISTSAFGGTYLTMPKTNSFRAVGIFSKMTRGQSAIGSTGSICMKAYPTNAEASMRRGIVGPNVLDLKKPTIITSIANEFSKPFYLYQNFLVWTWGKIAEPHFFPYFILVYSHCEILFSSVLVLLHGHC